MLTKTESEVLQDLTQLSCTLGITQRPAVILIGRTEQAARSLLKAGVILIAHKDHLQYAINPRDEQQFTNAGFAVDKVLY